MPIKKKKLSGFPEAKSFEGLFAFGVDKDNKSVKINLEEVDSAINKAQEVGQNPTYIGSDYYVYTYDLITKKYNKTDIYVKGEAGASGGAEAIVCHTIAELEAMTDVNSGTLGLVVVESANNKTIIKEGDVLDLFNIDTSKTPVFDWAPVPSGITPIVGFLDNQGVALNAIVCLNLNDVRLIAYQGVETGKTTFLFSSIDYVVEGEQLTAGWQKGVEQVNLGQSMIAKLSGLLSPDAPAIVNVVTNFNDIFSIGALVSGENSLYVKINDKWEPLLNNAKVDINVLESALPATTADQISHIRALNKQGESVNITKEESQNLILSDDVKTRVQTLAAMDYSLLTEQIVPGEFWLSTKGQKKQVYTQTYYGIMPTNTAIEELYVYLTPSGYVDDFMIVNGFMIGIEINATSQRIDNFMQYSSPALTTNTFTVSKFSGGRLLLYAKSAAFSGNYYSIAIKFTKQ